MSSPRSAGHWARRPAALLVLAVAAISVAAGLSPLAGDVRGALDRYASLRELPEGIGRERVSQTCLTCHSAMLITQQHKDSTAWSKSITLMEAWGAVIPDSTIRDTIQVYLVTHFGPRPAKPKTAPSSTATR